MRTRILTGDCRELLATLDAGSVQTCVTSPPYFGLRDYGVTGQIGLEPTVDAYVSELVAVFREVRRVLRDDGTLWLNLGDSYFSPTATQGRNEKRSAITSLSGHGADGRSPSLDGQMSRTYRRDGVGLKPKDLIGIPWRVAFALQADGWILRSDVIWHKPNPMPESVRDRPTKSHEYLFLLSKNVRYHYDAAAIAESSVEPGRIPGGNHKVDPSRNDAGRDMTIPVGATRNRRTVWTVSTRPFKGAHFATFPPALIEPCIKAGSKPGDTVLDPFGGAGTTALVANRLGRDAILVELNPEYAAMARRRIAADAPLLSEAAD